MWQRMFRGIGRTKWWLVVAGVLVVGFGIGQWWGQYRVTRLVESSRQLRNRNSNYDFISPLLAYISPDKSLFKEYRLLESQLSQAVGKAVDSNKAKRVAVYFRDLQTGHWTGVNEGEVFSPSSLFKVPAMIGLLKQAETDPALLNKKILYRHTSEEPISKYNSSTTTGLKFGQYYTVDKLMEAMIIDSDNDAKTLLVNLLRQDTIADLFGELEMSAVEKWAQGERYQLSPRQYSLLFRILYNGTFLNNDMSEKALSLLSRASFNEGLTAKLPKDVKVAHKFGVYDTGQPNSTDNALHDCGIVYVKDRAYFACVMTQGENYYNLSETISNISLTIYNYVISQKASS